MSQDESRREDALNPEEQSTQSQTPESQAPQEMPENTPQQMPEGASPDQTASEAEPHYPPRSDAGRPIGAAPDPQSTAHEWATEQDMGQRTGESAAPQAEPTPAQRTSQAAREQAGVAAGAFRRGEFMQDAAVDSAANSDDRLIALLSYVTQVFIPVVMPIIVLLSESSKQRPFQRYHAVQSLALTLLLVLIAIAATLGGLIIQIIPVVGQLVALLLFCLSPIAYLMAVIAMFYYGYQAYQGKRFAIPGLTTFLRDQGWLT